METISPGKKTARRSELWMVTPDCYNAPACLLCRTEAAKKILGRNSLTLWAVITGQTITIDQPELVLCFGMHDYTSYSVS